MKVLIINSVCKQGSTGRIAYRLYNAVRDHGGEAVVCYGRGDTYSNETNLIRTQSDLQTKIHVAAARLTGMEGYFSGKSTKKIIATIASFAPDAVVILNLHGYYCNGNKILRYLKLNNINTIYAMPDEYPFLGRCTYSNDCKQYLTGCLHCKETREYPKSLFFNRAKKIFKDKEKIYENFESIAFVSSPYAISKAKGSKLLKGKPLYAIDTGVDTNINTPKNAKSLREKLGIKLNQKIALNVAPFSSERKGVKYFLEAAKLLKQEDIAFINVGYDGKENHLPENFIPIKYVSNIEELSEYYSLADVLVCTSFQDAMPNVCLEALSCGTKVIGFNISGTPYVANEKFGTFVEPKNIGELANAIIKAPIKTVESIGETRNYALSRYTFEAFYENIIKIINNNKKTEGEKSDTI